MDLGHRRSTKEKRSPSAHICPSISAARTACGTSGFVFFCGRSQQHTHYSYPQSVVSENKRTECRQPVGCGRTSCHTHLPVIGIGGQVESLVNPPPQKMKHVYLLFWEGGAARPEVYPEHPASGLRSIVHCWRLTASSLHTYSEWEGTASEVFNGCVSSIVYGREVSKRPNSHAQSGKNPSSNTYTQQVNLVHIHPVQTTYVRTLQGLKERGGGGRTSNDATKHSKTLAY